MARIGDKGADGHRTILGIDFFQGTAREAVDRMKDGGLLVVPAAPALKDMETNAGYREALLEADLALTDSAFMVIVWNRLQGDSIRRLSGLEYLRELLAQPEVREPGSCVWIMASPASTEKNLAWLKGQGISVPEECVYSAPMYGAGSGGQGGGQIADAALLSLLERVKPRNIVLTLGGGTQERLGLYLKRNLSYRPAIHCIGAAIAFLSGDQVRIPVWADKYYLGWLFRSISEPKRYGPRYWEARKLFVLLRRYRERLPAAPV
jgi:UDP-N-acetyl-D-mannosaminuronic acid transferase (WecB/TagA/CpsF family)